MEIDSVDRISNLPEIILHNILSLLPREDPVKTSVLSKQWNRVWESFPILDFAHYSCKPFPECTKNIENFLNGVEKTLTRFALCNLKVHKFSLTVADFNPELSSKIEKYLELALNSGAIKIRILHWQLYVFQSRGDFVPLPETGIASNRFKCYHHLQDLFLSGFSLSEESIHGIVHNCPNIRSLNFTSMNGLRMLKINKLERLEEVSISTCQHLSVDIDAPNLREFCFVSFCNDMPNFTIFNLITCRSLRKLSLDQLTITDEFFHSLISWFPLLEDLSINYFKMLRRVSVSAQYLTRLIINNCNKIEAIEIDAPALSSFRYEAEILPRLFLKSIPSHMEIVLGLCFDTIGTHHFINLREFLAISTVGDFLTAKVGIKAKFDLDKLRQVVIPTPFQLQHLKVEFPLNKMSLDVGALVDGLLWSCHPKKISVFWDTVPQNNFIKILCESLLEMEKYPTCCGSSTVKCWRHDLKSARIEGGLKGQHWTLLLPPDDAKDSVICFNLEWDYSIS